MHLVLLPIYKVFLQFSLKGMMNFQNLRKIKKDNFPTDRPIPEKQGRVRGNKNIFKVGLSGENESRNSANTGKLALFFQMQASRDPVSLQSDVSLSFALFGCSFIKK